MLKRISIQNFKGIGSKVDIDLRPVTLLFGANSAGKSTILHALHYAHAVLATGNAEVDATLLGGNIRLGGFQSFVHQHDLGKTVNIGFSFEPDDDDLMQTEADDDWTDINEIGVNLTVKWSPLLFLNRAIVTAYSIAINGIELARISCGMAGTDTKISDINTAHPLLCLDEPAAFQQSIPCLEGRKSAIPQWNRNLGMEPSYAGIGDILAPTESGSTPLDIVETWLLKAGHAALRHLDRFLYLGPFRSLPPRKFQAPLQPESNRWSSGLGAWDALSESQALRGHTNTWLEKMHVSSRIKSNQIFEFTMETLKKRMKRSVPRIAELFVTGHPRRNILVMVNQQGTELDVCDLGEGIGQVVPVLVSALFPAVTTPSGESMPVSFVAIEQPELHIHPRMQVVLADLFLSQSDGRQFLIETHSEHLILRLLRRIRQTSEGELKKGEPPTSTHDVAVYYAEQTNGEVKFRRLRISDDGEFIDRWPEGFFSERLQELL